MSSPAAVAFRALVMLGCLVAVPLVAVFNAPVRDYLHKLIDSHNAVADSRPAANGPAPLFNDPNNTPYRASTATSPTSPAAVPASSGGTVANNSTPSQFSNTANGLNPLGNRPGAPATLPPAAGNDLANARAAAAVSPGNPPAVPANGAPATGGAIDRSIPQFPVQQASFEQQVNAPRNSAADYGLPPANEPLRPATNVAAGGTKTPPPNPDSFKEIERRIQGLGATYYRLETDGRGPDPYRFYCMVSMSGDPNHNRVFEARDSDPLRAMEKVLRDVESVRR